MYSVGKVLIRVFLLGILVGVVLSEKVSDWKKDIKRAKAETR